MSREDAEKDFKEITRRIANTLDGMMYIKHLTEKLFVNFRTDFDQPNKTYYGLGRQHELKELLKRVEDKERFERVIITSRFDKKEDKL